MSSHQTSENLNFRSSSPKDHEKVIKLAHIISKKNYERYSRNLFHKVFHQYFEMFKNRILKNLFKKIKNINERNSKKIF